MSAWYVPSLYPILLLTASLALLVLWRDRRHLPIAACCASITAWTTSILLAASPATQAWGDRTMMVGFFIPATFLHVAARELGWSTTVVRAVHALGAVMFVSAAAIPNLYLFDGGTRPGPLFVPMLLATAAVGVTPWWMLWRDRASAESEERRRYLLLACTTMLLGGGVNIALLLAEARYPIGLYLLTCAAGLITYVAQATHLPAFGRFIERSQRYALLAALLSALWMFLLLTAVQGSSGWEPALLLFVLALTAQPLLTEARVRLADRLFPGQGDADGLTRELARLEAEAEHRGRLAALGTMTAAVAHEVRNPLGVIAACAAVLERQGADAGTVQELRDQVTRAARFADELLEYGRPAPPQRRPVSLADAARVGLSDVTRALGVEATVEVDGDATLEADPAQLARLVGLLAENALLAGCHRLRVHIVVDRQVHLTLDDDGPGVPPEIAPRLFQPFVTGRARSRPGTGLGLAIGRGIAERHGGTLHHAGRGALGGASFVLTLPREDR